MSQSKPDTLGKYQIIREIARSNDIVYEGYDPVMNRRVAVKELSVPGGSTDTQKQDRVRRFQREAKAAGSLVHPNIVTVYDVDVEDGRYYLAMEFLDGHTLRKELEQNGFLDPAEAIDTAIEVLKALAFAHKHGVVHRDVKPENIQILENGAIKLTDFGIARLTFEPNITMDGQVFGTPSYMSPEQIHGKEIDARSDIFSMGTVLFEMLSGQKPFSGDSVVAITYAIMNQEPNQPPQASHTLWSVIQKALDKSPALRYASADAMIADLRTAKNNLSAQVLDPVSPQSSAHGWGTPPAGLVNPYAPPVLASPINNQYPPGVVPYSAGGASQYQAHHQAQQGIVYAPYSPGMSTHNVYGQPYSLPSVMNPAQIPVYYPPPPRPAFVSPETVHALKRVVLVMLLLGLLGVAIVVGLSSASRGTGGASNSRPSETRVAGSPNGGRGNEGPVGAGVGEEGPVTGATAPRSSPEARSEPQPPAARDVSAMVAEADQLVHEGASATNPFERRELWSQADNAYVGASEASENARTVTLHAAQVYESVADMLVESGERAAAREALYHALPFAAGSAPEYDRLAARINSMLEG